MYKNVYVLDSNHTAYFLYSGDNNLFGLIVEHQCIDGPLEELLPFRDDGYTLLSDDPITLDRYILCHECGDYGSVIEGDWVTYDRKRK